MQRLSRSDDATPKIDSAGLSQVKARASDDATQLSGSQNRSELQNRPGLLVSVRSLDEARMAAESNVSIIDLKEPQKGALGAASLEAWRAVANELADCSLSVAMGELDEAIPLAGQVPSEFRFAKAGPVGARSRDQLVGCWQSLRSHLPRSVELVAVAYADYEQAGTLSVETIFAAAHDAGLDTWLLDTYVKDGRSSVEHLGLQRLGSLLQHAANSNAHFALAGSLTLSAVKQSFGNELCPSWFAVRGDVCEQGRSGNLSSERILRWTSWLELNSRFVMR